MGGQADKLSCGMRAFVLSVEVQMNMMRSGVQARFREKVGCGGMGVGREQDWQKLNLAVLLKGR